jgi:hypothetical protein
MKNLLILGLLCYFQITVSFGQKINRKTNFRTENIIDTSIIAIIPFDASKSWFFEQNKPTQLTSYDIELIEKLLKKCIEKYNSEQLKGFKNVKNQAKNELNPTDYLVDLSKYKRQYVATINSKGETEVWVNCFCDSWNTDWKKEILVVFDGGYCFFNLKLNLNRKNYFDLRFNGVS